VSILGTVMECNPTSDALSAASPHVLREREATCPIDSSTLSAMTSVRLFTGPGLGKTSRQGGGALWHSLAVRALVSPVLVNQLHTFTAINSQQFVGIYTSALRVRSNPLFQRTRLRRAAEQNR